MSTNQIPKHQTGRTPLETLLRREHLATRQQFDQAIKIRYDQNCSLFKALELAIAAPLPPHIFAAYRRFALFELSIVYGMRSLEVDYVFDISTIVQLMDSELPLNLCRLHKFLPLEQSDTTLLLGMVHFDLRTPDQIRRFAKNRAELRLEYRLMLAEDYEHIFNQVIDYHAASSAASSEDTEFDNDNFSDSTENYPPDPPIEFALTPFEIEPPVIKLTNQILLRAVKNGASGISIEPLGNIRFRVDGKYQDYIELPRKIMSALINRFKVMADLMTQPYPQIGIFRRLFQQESVYFHVHILPIAGGEKAVIKVLDSTKYRQTLDWIMIDASTCAIAKQLCRQRSGLVVVAGDIDSGVTTTLYSLLEQAHNPHKNTYTLENPIGVSLSGITQVQVKPHQNIADVWRSLPNPQVALVTPITPEIGRMLMEAGSGCLIFTSLSADHSITALNQLMAMTGSEPLGLSAIIFQHLLPRLCDRCRISYHPTLVELNACGIISDRNSFYKAHLPLSHQAVCPQCSGTGYHGRIAALEIMTITENLQTAITQGHPAEYIRDMAISGGMKSILEYSLNLARQGYTTLEQIAQIIAANPLLHAEKERQLGRSSSIDSPVTSSPLGNLKPDEIFLSMIETLDLLDAWNWGIEPQTLREQVLDLSCQKLRSQLQHILQTTGIRRMEPIGQPFDPMYHEAVMERPTSSQSVYMVIDQFQAGYQLGDRILRRAQVEVTVPRRIAPKS